MEFLEIFLRQAHPGERRGSYRTYEEKLEGAREYSRQEQLPWPVVVDDLAGTVHRTYSQEMADPVFLVDAVGRVAFYGMWTHVPTLKRAIDELLADGQRAPVAGGLDRRPHLLASFVDGFRGPMRGGLRAVFEYDLGGLGAGTLSFLGSRVKPVLAPVALRAEPLPDGAKVALAAGLAMLSAAAIASRRR